MKESFKSEPLPVSPSKVVVKATERELRKVARWAAGWTFTPAPPVTGKRVRLRFLDSNTKPAFKP